MKLVVGGVGSFKHGILEKKMVYPGERIPEEEAKGYSTEVRRHRGIRGKKTSHRLIHIYNYMYNTYHLLYLYTYI